jgi:undecaprenyl-diphosphatase
MAVWEAIVLGVVQGAAEFLPISSSGHLAVLEHLWRVPESARLPLTVALHLGTAVAVVVFFARRIGGIVAGLFSGEPGRCRAAWRMAGMIAAASVPAAVVGLGFGDAIDRAFASPIFVGICLLVTGAVLFGTRFLTPGCAGLGWRRAVLVGLAQAVAVLPGVSRSGATITAGLYSGLGGEAAFEFSFLLSVPAVLGAAALELPELASTGLDPAAAGLGAAVALASGLAALWLLRRAVAGGRLHFFAYYCWLAGLAVLLFVR